MYIQKIELRYLRIYKCTIYHSLVASGLLLGTSCELQVAGWELRVASCELQVASCKLEVASCLIV